MARPPRVNISATIVIAAIVLISAALLFAFVSQISAQGDESIGVTVNQAPTPQSASSIFSQTSQITDLASAGGSGACGRSVSANGEFVVFWSEANNLVPDDTNNVPDLFLYDRVASSVSRIFEGTTGRILCPFEISSDGNYIAFGVEYQIYLYDRMRNTSSRISSAPDGSEANGMSIFPSISSDGRRVAFTSVATNLVPDDTSAIWKVFIYDADSPNSFLLLWNTLTGTPLEYHQGDVRLSHDGNHIALISSATNLTPEFDDGIYSDAFLFDLSADSGSYPERVSVAYPNGLSNGESGWGLPDISTDNQYVVFSSQATNLTSMPQSNSEWNTYVRDTVDDITEIVSVSSQGEKLGAGSDGESISGDGRYVVFVTQADKDSNRDANAIPNVFVRDRLLGKTSLVSMSFDGKLANYAAILPVISENGQWVVFESRASNLVPNDTNQAYDFFLHNFLTGQTFLVSKPYSMAPTYSIRGRVTDDNGGPVAGVRVTAGQAGATSQIDGTYVIEGLPAGTYSIKPLKEGYSSLPDSRTIGLSSNTTGQDFVLTLPGATYSISGQVTDGENRPIAGVTLSLSNGQTNTTNSDGQYVFLQLAAGQYTAKPTGNKLSFEPRSKVIDVPPNTTANFSGGCPSGQWFAKYYPSQDLTGTPVSVGCEQDVDYYWPTGSKVGDSEELTTTFSARWTRTIQIETPETYIFRAFSDDRVRLLVDAVELVSDWEAGPFRERSETLTLGTGSHTLRLEYANTDGDAIVDLGWYLCPNDASDCNLGITPQYQTAYNDDPMPLQCLAKQDPTATIARWGCNITSIAMALQSLGIQTTPRELNAWLSYNKGYVQNPKDPCDGNLASRSAIEAFALEKFKKQIRWNPVAPASSIVEAIRSQKPPLPVILHSADGHFTLATSVVNINGQETVGISDPWHSWRCPVVADTSSSGPSKTKLACGSAGKAGHVNTLAELVTQEGTTVPVGYYAPLDDDRTASLSIWIFGAEALLTDTVGRQVGYNPATGQVIVERPNASYGDEQITPLGSLIDPGPVERTIYLGSEARGAFTLAFYPPSDPVTQAADRQVGISIVGYDESLVASEVTYTATLVSGMQLKLDYTPGQPPQLTPQTTNGLYLYLPNISR